MYKIILCFLCILFLTMCKERNNLTKKTGQYKKAMTVEAMIVSLKEVEHSYTFTGTIMANEEIELRTETSGRITGIYFNEGNIVKKGQLLVKINDSEIQAQLQKVKLQMELALSDESRKKELLKIKAVSNEVYEISSNHLKTLQAEVINLQAQIAKTEIIAPFTGYVGLRMVSPGAYVVPSTLIASMVQTDPVKIDFSIPEKYLNHALTGTQIQFSTSSNEQLYSAVIYAIESKVDPGTRTIRLRARCSNSKNLLIPGSFAYIRWDIFPGVKRVMVPARALIPVMDGEQVYLVKNGKALSMDVKTGIRTKNEVEITEGLSAGDTLIISGLLQLKKGTTVKPIIK